MTVSVAELRSLLAEARTALSDSVFEPGHGYELATRFLSAAPTDLCLRLAEAWGQAKSEGMPAAAFSTEDQSLLDMVAGVYTVPAAHMFGPALQSLLGDITAEAA